jgi:hypothetical protein
MTPERSEAIIRSIIASIGIWIEELEIAESIRPVPTPAVQHVIATMRQARVSLQQMIERD